MIYPLHHDDSFYPSFPSSFFYIPLQGVKLTEGDNSLLWLLFIMSQKTDLYVI